MTKIKLILTLFLGSLIFLCFSGLLLNNLSVSAHEILNTNSVEATVVQSEEQEPIECNDDDEEPTNIDGYWRCCTRIPDEQDENYNGQYTFVCDTPKVRIDTSSN